jgi:UDPglucose--hexose-1-phosphate uridylyltransferase
MPEFRKDPASRRWVIISSERAKRPQAGVDCSAAPLARCPFCAGNEEETPPEVLAYRAPKTPADRPGWSVRVVPNKFPALAPQSEDRDAADGFYEARPGTGVHEVIIESPEHVVHTRSLDERQLAMVLRAYRQRMLHLAAERRWRYLLVYKNEGRKAGATIEHVHSQLIALPHVPTEVLHEVDAARHYQRTNGGCLYCRMIENEIGGRARLVSETERFVTLCPFAPRFPFETWILPKIHGACFERCSDDDYAEFARCLREILMTLHRSLKQVPFNYLIHSAPLAASTHRYYHWHMELLPRLAQAAGFEWGSGSFMNPVSPEDAANILRGASKDVPEDGTKEPA